jgi:hypothetical protein
MSPKHGQQLEHPAVLTMASSYIACMRLEHFLGSNASGHILRRMVNLLPWIEGVVALAIFTMAIRVDTRDSQCFARTFSWSPATTALEHHWRSFENIDFFNVPPKYLGVNQTNELEEAWQELLPGRSSHCGQLITISKTTNCDR